MAALSEITLVCLDQALDTFINRQTKRIKPDVTILPPFFWKAQDWKKYNKNGIILAVDEEKDIYILLFPDKTGYICSDITKRKTWMQIGDNNAHG